jgi:hypothetical protein
LKLSKACAKIAQSLSRWRKSLEVGDNGVARYSTQLNENEETPMLIDRRHLWGLVLALVSIVAGLALLGQSARFAAPELFIQLPALLLMIYGLIVAWWHTHRAISVFEVRTARAVHRALHSHRGRGR